MTPDAGAVKKYLTTEWAGARLICVGRTQMMTAEDMMEQAMMARMDNDHVAAAQLYTVAADMLLEEGRDARAGIANYWARQCSTHPLMRGVCRVVYR